MGEEVERSGDKLSTWKTLSLKLNRDPNRSVNIRNHYLYGMKRQGEIRRKFSIQEDQMIIEKLFKGKDSSIETVRNAKITYTEGIPEMNRNVQNVNKHWLRAIKPILMTYHLGILHSNWKYNFLKYIVEKEVNHPKEIDCNEVCKLFPAQTVESMRITLTSYLRSEGVPLCKAIKENLYKRKQGDDYSEKEKSHRENIVKLYLDACN